MYCGLCLPHPTFPLSSLLFLSVAADTTAFLRLEDVVYLSDDSGSSDEDGGGGGDEMVDGSVDIPITNLAVRANPVTDCSR